LIQIVKNLQLKKLLFFDKKLHFTYPWASIKDVHTTGEAFSPQKRRSRIQYLKFLNFMPFLCVIFALLDSDMDSGSSGSTELIESGSGTETLPEMFFFMFVEQRRNLLPLWLLAPLQYTFNPVE
jgi:hypothetical protein